MPRRKKDDSELLYQFKKGSIEPKIAFKEMNAYVDSVIRGLQPGCILCGAPGVGKSYRVLNLLKKHGYVNGQNLDIIKGKCTARQLYLSLYNHREKGEIILIDDADALVGPHAPEDVINILKGALDSTREDDGGRLVSYRIASEIKDDEGIPVPKRMSFYGSVIVITNYSVAQLDSALKGRVFTQSLDFTTNQLLDIIKELMPSIEPDRLSDKAKMQAYEYIQDLSNKRSDIEISIRTFGTCARLFQLAEESNYELTPENVKHMISEQLVNGYLKTTNKKYAY